MNITDLISIHENECDSLNFTSLRDMFTNIPHKVLEKVYRDSGYNIENAIAYACDVNPNLQVNDPVINGSEPNYRSSNPRKNNVIKEEIPTHNYHAPANYSNVTIPIVSTTANYRNTQEYQTYLIQVNSSLYQLPPENHDSYRLTCEQHYVQMKFSVDEITANAIISTENNLQLQKQMEEQRLKLQQQEQLLNNLQLQKQVEEQRLKLQQQEEIIKKHSIEYQHQFLPVNTKPNSNDLALANPPNPVYSINPVYSEGYGDSDDEGYGYGDDDEDCQTTVTQSSLALTPSLAPSLTPSHVPSPQSVSSSSVPSSVESKKLGHEDTTKLDNENKSKVSKPSNDTTNTTNTTSNDTTNTTKLNTTSNDMTNTNTKPSSLQSSSISNNRSVSDNKTDNKTDKKTGDNSSHSQDMDDFNEMMSALLSVDSSSATPSKTPTTQTPTLSNTVSNIPSLNSPSSLSQTPSTQSYNKPSDTVSFSKLDSDSKTDSITNSKTDSKTDSTITDSITDSNVSENKSAENRSVDDSDNDEDEDDIDEEDEEEVETDHELHMNDKETALPNSDKQEDLSKSFESCSLEADEDDDSDDFLSHLVSHNVTLALDSVDVDVRETLLSIFPFLTSNTIIIDMLTQLSYGVDSCLEFIVKYSKPNDSEDDEEDVIFDYEGLINELISEIQEVDAVFGDGYGDGHIDTYNDLLYDSESEDEHPAPVPIPTITATPTSTSTFTSASTTASEEPKDYHTLRLLRRQEKRKKKAEKARYEEIVNASKTVDSSDTLDLAPSPSFEDDSSLPKDGSDDKDIAVFDLEELVKSQKQRKKDKQIKSKAIQALESYYNQYQASMSKKRRNKKPSATNSTLSSLSVLNSGMSVGDEMIDKLMLDVLRERRHDPTLQLSKKELDEEKVKFFQDVKTEILASALQNQEKAYAKQQKIQKKKKVEKIKSKDDMTFEEMSLYYGEDEARRYFVNGRGTNNGYILPTVDLSSIPDSSQRSIGEGAGVNGGNVWYSSRTDAWADHTVSKFIVSEGYEEGGHFLDEEDNNIIPDIQFSEGLQGCDDFGREWCFIDGNLIYFDGNHPPTYMLEMLQRQQNRYSKPSAPRSKPVQTSQKADNFKAYLENERAKSNLQDFPSLSSLYKHPSPQSKKQKSKKVKVNKLDDLSTLVAQAQDKLLIAKCLQVLKKQADAKLLSSWPSDKEITSLILDLKKTYSHVDVSDLVVTVVDSQFNKDTYSSLLNVLHTNNGGNDVVTRIGSEFKNSLGSSATSQSGLSVSAAPFTPATSFTPASSLSLNVVEDRVSLSRPALDVNRYQKKNHYLSTHTMRAHINIDDYKERFDYISQWEPAPGHLSAHLLSTTKFSYLSSSTLIILEVMLWKAIYGLNSKRNVRDVDLSYFSNGENIAFQYDTEYMIYLSDYDLEQVLTYLKDTKSEYKELLYRSTEAQSLVYKDRIARVEEKCIFINNLRLASNFYHFNAADKGIIESGRIDLHLQYIPDACSLTRFFILFFRARMALLEPTEYEASQNRPVVYQEDRYERNSNAPLEYPGIVSGNPTVKVPSVLKLIVGKGVHNDTNTSKLYKPVMKVLYSLRCKVTKESLNKNPGVITVVLKGWGGVPIPYQYSQE